MNKIYEAYKSVTLNESFKTILDRLVGKDVIVITSEKDELVGKLEKNKHYNDAYNVDAYYLEYFRMSEVKRIIGNKIYLNITPSPDNR